MKETAKAALTAAYNASALLHVIRALLVAAAAHGARWMARAGARDETQKGRRAAADATAQAPFSTSWADAFRVCAVLARSAVGVPVRLVKHLRRKTTKNLMLMFLALCYGICGCPGPVHGSRLSAVSFTPTKRSLSRVSLPSCGSCGSAIGSSSNERAPSFSFPHMQCGVLIVRCAVARGRPRVHPSRKHLGRAPIRLQIALSLETASKNRRYFIDDRKKTCI